MDSGELLTRLTVWIALAGYALGTAAGSLARSRLRWQRVARWAWSLGCLSLVLHFACAFHFYHGWSQAAAYRETARQTAEVFGLDWGGGLYINYLFLGLWAADAVWWWGRGLRAYERRSRLIGIALHAFMLFIIFNATVVFKTGMLRWLGVGLSGGLLLLWALRARRDKVMEEICS